MAKTIAVKYTGPHDAVDVPGFGTVKRNEVVDVPEKLAGDSNVGLLAQSTWTTATKGGNS